MPKKLEKEIVHLLVTHRLASANWLGCALGLRSYDRVRSAIAQRRGVVLRCAA